MSFFICFFVCSFRSLPDENLKAQVMLEPCTQANLEPCLSNEAPKSDVHIQPAGNNASAPPSEPRKSRVRERRREGRSKTFDWSEFKMQQSEKPVKERADTVDLSSSFSTTSSYCSPSTSPSSLASSPVSTSTLQTSSVSGVSPSSVAEEVEKENVRRTVPPHSTTSASHMPNTVTVTMASTLNSTPLVQPLTPESQEQGKMEVDHPAAMHSASEDRDNRTTDVHEEIEQRWHQVETIPLREEKQVPITTALGNSGNSDRLPSNELAALLDKEVCLLNIVMWSHYVYDIRAFCAICLYFSLFLFFCSVGTQAEGAGPTTEGEQPFERAAGRCTRKRAKCKGGLCTAGTTLIINHRTRGLVLKCTPNTNSIVTKISFTLKYLECR